MPTWRGLLRDWPHAVLRASEGAVGLPPGQMGNSEVGHLNLGAGRPVLQDLPRIDAAIADGSFFERPALLEACRRAAEPGGRLHVISLIGPGGVHANDRHLVALAELAAETGRPGRPGPRAARRPRHAAEVGPRLRRRPRGPARDGAPRRADRLDRRALLRDGPRQPLGPRRARLRRDRPRRRRARAERDGRHRGRLRPRRERRVRGADRHRRGRRHGPPGRPGDPRQLPGRPRPPARPRARRPGVRGLRPGRARRPAGPDRPVRRDADRVRGRPAGRGRLPAGGGALARPGLLRGRLAPVPRRRDREVRPRHVFLQRRRRAAVSGEERRLIPSPRSRPTTSRRR